MSIQKKSSLKKQNRVLILEREQRTSNTPILPCSFAVWGQSLPGDGQFRYEFGEQRIGQPAGRVVGQPFLPLSLQQLDKVLRDWKVEETDFRSFVRAFVPPPRLLADGTAWQRCSRRIRRA